MLARIAEKHALEAFLEPSGSLLGALWEPPDPSRELFGSVRNLKNPSSDIAAMLPEMSMTAIWLGKINGNRLGAGYGD